MKCAPIIVFAYNRPEHLSRTLSALKQNDLAAESNLFIFCDGAKVDAEKKQLANIEEVRKIAHSVEGFNAVHVIERQQNVGLANNITWAVTEIVNQYGRVITLEDDIVTSRGFLKYMNDALELYKDDSKVMHISAYMFPHKCHLPNTFFHQVPYPGGGWATWQRAWQFFNENTRDLYDYWKDRWDEFNTNGGVFYQRQLEDNLSGKAKTWFVKWHAVMLQMGGLTLYPGRSLTTNIGFDETATNCNKTNKYYIYHLAPSVKVMRVPLIINKKGKRAIYDFYQGHWYNKRRRNALLAKIKAIVKC